MQFRIYDKKTIEYIDGGYVASYDIDDDYIVNNNSTIKVVKREPERKKFFEHVVTGDIIVLIQDSGAFHKGVITAIDPTALTVSYRSDKELFNNNILNPMAASEAFDEDSETKVAGRFGVEWLIALLDAHFNEGEGKDPYFTLPLVFQANGDVLMDVTDEDGTVHQEPRMLWTWDSDSINVKDWFTELFEKYNLTMSWEIDFDMAQETLSKRKPRYIVTLSAITNGGNLIKDNVKMQTITYTEHVTPESTVAYVIDSETKKVIMESERNLLSPSKLSIDTRLDEKNNTIKSNDEGAYALYDYIAIKATTTINNKEEWQPYTLSFRNPYDNYLRWIWCYDKDKTRICGVPYRCVKGVQYPDGKIITGKEALEYSTADDLYEEEDIRDIVFYLAFDADILIQERGVINGKYANKDGSFIPAKVKDPDTGETRLETEEETKARLAKLVRYVRICIPDKYYSTQEFEQLVQLEEGSTLTPYSPFELPAIYYLYEKDGEYSIGKDANPKDTNRVLPAKNTVISFNTSSESGENITPYEAARDKLVPQFNQAIEIRILSDSKMFDFQNAQFGDQYKIVNEHGSIDSVFTGKKMSSKDKWVTLYFGLGRQRYSDIIQIRTRHRQHTELYNQ